MYCIEFRVWSVCLFLAGYGPTRQIAESVDIYTNLSPTRHYSDTTHRHMTNAAVLTSEDSPVSAY